jgi:hypothetical protein
MQQILQNLLEIMCIPPSQFRDFTVTSDGYILAQRHSDVGFSTFLGTPNPNRSETTINYSWSKFLRLSFSERKLVAYWARAKGISLRDFLERKSWNT